MSRFAPRIAASAWKGLAGGVGILVAQALPPRCPGCGEPVAADHRFCAACWSSLHLIGPPWCATCNLPFTHAMGESAQCAACLADPPRHRGVRAAVAYGPIARQLALRLKYGGRMGIATTMAQRIAPLVPADVDLLVPVPLHRWRLWSRGYNQAGLIAAALARETGLRHHPFALTRRRRTAALRGMGRKARARAVKGAFAVPDPARVRGLHIGLVDDVYTSGATTDACTAVLLRAGAASVTILCWARVIAESDD